MSSIFDYSFENQLQQYLSEFIAVSLFAVGYFLFKHFNQKKQFDQKSGAKLQTQTVTSTVTEQSPKKQLYQYNLYIRDNLSHKPNLNPFDVLNQMQLEGVLPDLTSYNTLLDTCFKQRNFEQALQLFEEMNDQLSQVKPDIITFNTVLKGMSLQIEDFKNETQLESHLEKIIQTKEKILELNMVPNEITYNTIIDAHVKANLMTKAFQIYDEMQKRQNLTPDAFTYSTLIKGMKKPECLQQNPTQSLEKVFRILQEIKENKLVKLDEIIYNCVIDACFKFGDFNKAIQLYKDMVSEKISPSSVTYGIMIKGYGAFKAIDQALQMYNEMISNKIDLNEVTFGCLIDACVSCGKLDKALQLLEQQQANVPINIIIYTTLIKGFTKEKNFDKALETFNKMKHTDTKPNLVTYNSVLDCAVQCNKFDQMEQLWAQILSQKQQELQPDIISYSTYIKGLCKNHRAQEAYNIFLKLRDEKVHKLDEVLYNSILDGLLKSQDYQKMFYLHELMQEDNIKPSNVTYSILIRLHNNTQQLDKALDLLNEMKNDQLRPGLIVYTCLIQGCIKNKKIDKVVELYRDMESLNVRGDGVFYNTLISGLMFNHRMDLASEITIKTLESNVRLNDEVYNNLLKNLCKLIEKKYKNSGLSEQDAEINLLKICQEMKVRNMEIEINLYNQIVTLLSKENLEKHIALALQQKRNNQNQQQNGQGFNNSNQNSRFTNFQGNYNNNYVQKQGYNTNGYNKQQNQNSFNQYNNKYQQEKSTANTTSVPATSSTQQNSNSEHKRPVFFNRNKQ